MPKAWEVSVQRSPFRERWVGRGLLQGEAASAPPAVLSLMRGFPPPSGPRAHGDSM